MATHWSRINFVHMSMYPLLDSPKHEGDSNYIYCHSIIQKVGNKFPFNSIQNRGKFSKLHPRVILVSELYP